MRLVLILSMLLGLGACSTSHELTSCRGSFAAANPGQWTPAPSDLAGNP